ncbi:universal stress protein [Legionella quinlivanii]|uniref:universal stress protein n=1 Tax=Legionella quinlivanii TaxID=45073 RepID=UPI002244BD13|nr:universal stress protein [Legionella quinlivanii]MCW8450711.1 universal stress protein [Legionella quinlivanii]
MYKIILHATDLKENHRIYCQQAVKLAKAFNAELHFLHVIEPPKSLQFAQSLGFAEIAKPSKEDAQTVMDLLCESLGIPPEQQYIEIGTASQHILQKIKELGCDLVILGSHSSSIPAFLGSTANAVMHHASCDMLTLRNTETG